MSRWQSQLDRLWPTCAVCKKPVEKLEWAEDIRCYEIMVVAKCHGQTDSCRLSHEILTFHTLMPGHAFVTQALTEREKEIRALLPSIGELNEIAFREIKALSKKDSGEI